MYLGYPVTQIPGGLQQIMSGTDKSIGAMRNGHLYLFMHKFHDLPLPVPLTVTSKSWNNSLALFVRACLCRPSGGGTSISNQEPNISIR